MLALLPILAAVAAQATPMATDTPVLSRTVERGDILAAKDFAVESRPVSQGRGAVTAQAADGMEATRRLPAGAVLRAGDIVTPRLVRRGEPVMIYLRSGGLTISTEGRALDSGADRDRVRVVASSTNRTLDAVVEGAGTVRVGAR